MPFEHYDPEGIRRSKRPQVRIEKTFGRFVLNYAAWKALGSPPYVKFLYDREQQRIGIEAAWERSSQSFATTKRTDAASRIVTARSFLATYEIDYTQSRVFDAEIENNILILDMKSGQAPRGHGIP